MTPAPHGTTRHYTREDCKQKRSLQIRLFLLDTLRINKQLREGADVEFIEGARLRAVKGISTKPIRAARRDIGRSRLTCCRAAVLLISARGPSRSGSRTFSSAQAAAVDVSGAAIDIALQAAPIGVIGVIGAACLLVYGAVKAFGWVRGALK